MHIRVKLQQILSNAQAWPLKKTCHIIPSSWYNELDIDKNLNPYFLTKFINLKYH